MLRDVSKDEPGGIEMSWSPLAACRSPKDELQFSPSPYS